MSEMRADPLLDPFDDCLSRLAAGDSLDDCLGRYPELALTLRPMLETAQQAVAASRVPRQAQMRSRARFLAAAVQKRPARTDPGGGLIRRILTTAFSLFVGVALGLTGLFYASADTVPGDGLYMLKLTVEDIRLQFADGPAGRFALEEEFAERRKLETQTLLAQGQDAVVEFSDTLVSRDGQRWQVGDFTLQLTDSTVVVGDPPPGYFVAVTAELSKGRLEAVRIVAREEEIAGRLSGAGERWAVDGTAFTLIPASRVTGTLESGAAAIVRLRQLQSGGVVAMSVTVLAPPSATPPAPLLATPTPAGTPPPAASTSTQVPTPFPTPRPTSTSEPAPTAEPTGDDDDDNDNDNSGPGGGNSGLGGGGGDGDDNSGPGGGGDDGDDNSGPGGGGGDGDDNSGPGGGGGGDGDDNSGPGGGGGDD
jgi:hypothetical protein